MPGKRVNLLPEGMNLKGWQIWCLLSFDRVWSSQNSSSLNRTGSKILNLLLLHTSNTYYVVHENICRASLLMQRNVEIYTFKSIFSMGLKCFKVSAYLETRRNKRSLNPIFSVVKVTIYSDFYCKMVVVDYYIME